MRLAIPGDLLRRNPPNRGAGRIYHSVLPRLAQIADVQVRPARQGLRKLWPRGIDVWIDGAHSGAVSHREPTIVVAHGGEFMTHPEAFPGLPSEYVEGLRKNTLAALETADLVVTGSDHTRRALMAGAGVPEDKVLVVHHGVDTTVFRPELEGGSALVAARLGERRPYVLFIGVDSPTKNLGALRAAISGVARAGLPHVLVIAGPPVPAHTDRGVERSATGETLLWLGAVDTPTVAMLMADAACFCLPSLMESFPLVVLEALACGTPVVVSDRGGIPEMVGEAGWLCAPDANEIERGLVAVLQDSTLRTRLGREGRERAEQFTWERTAQGWLRAAELAA